MCAVQKVRDSAGKVSCQNNLRQVAIALHSYHDEHKGLPLRPSVRPPMTTLSWKGHILPQVGQTPLWLATESAFNADKYAFRNPPHIGFATVVKTYLCSQDSRLSRPITDQFGKTAAYSSYVGIAGVTTSTGVLGPYPGIRFADVTDGTSQTVMVGERPPPDSLLAGRWYTASDDGPTGTYRGPENSLFILSPAFLADPLCIGPIYSYRYGRLDNPCDRYHLWSLHSGGANFAFADGSVRFLAYSADSVLPALATRAGGEVATLPD